MFTLTIKAKSKYPTMGEETEQKAYINDHKYI